MTLETRIQLDDVHLYIDVIEYPLNVTANCNACELQVTVTHQADYVNVIVPM